MEVWTLIFAGLAVAVPIALWRLDHYQRTRAPHVEILLDRTSTDGLSPCPGWAPHSVPDPACFITVRNMRSVPMTITEAFIRDPSKERPLSLQATNIPQDIPAGLCHRYEILMGNFSNPTACTLVLRSGLWERIYPFQ